MCDGARNSVMSTPTLHNLQSLRTSLFPASNEKEKLFTDPTMARSMLHKTRLVNPDPRHRDQTPPNSPPVSSSSTDISNLTPAPQINETTQTNETLTQSQHPVTPTTHMDETSNQEADNHAGRGNEVSPDITSATCIQSQSSHMNHSNSNLSYSSSAKSVAEEITAAHLDDLDENGNIPSKENGEAP